MSTGRVFRKGDQGWEAIGDQLPAWDHVPPRPNDPMSVWVLPAECGYLAGDVVAFAETGHRLLSLVPPGDAAWQQVIDSALLLHEPAQVREWVASVELWLAQRLPEGWQGRRSD